MATAEPITIPLVVDDAAARDAMARFVAGMTSAAEKTAEAGNAAKIANTAWTETKSAVDLAAMAFQRLVGLADQVAALTAEQQQLSAASARLGLDFNQAADNAGRFVDETEAMAAASRLAEAGLHLTQEELNQLTARAAIASQRLGVDTTTAFNMLTTAIESGSTRALRPFGEDMVRLGGSTHSAEERLSAFTTTTRGMERATDDASSSMARLRDSIGDAEREAASAFSAEVLRLQEVTTQTDRLSTRVDDTEHKLRALGQLAATAATATLNGIAAIAGAVAMGIVGTIAMARGSIAGLQAMVHGGSFSDALAATVRGDEASRDVMQFLEGRIAALNALADDNGSTAGRGAVRGRIGAAGAAAPSGDMVFGESQADADDAFAAANRRGRTGGSRRRGQTLDQLMGRASGSVLVFGSGGDRRLAEGDEDERNAAGKAAAQRQADEGAVAAERAREESIARTAAGKRPGADDSISGRLSTQLRQYGDTTRHVRDQVVSAMSDMTEAVATHFEAWVKGREGFAAAAQGMLSDFLGAVAKRASVSAAEEAAAALASLAVGNLPGAGLHAAAAAGFGVVAGLAGLASQAVAPTPASPTGGAASGARSAADVTPRAAGKGGADGGQVVNVYFGGPVIGAGGARQAAREVVGVLNDGARQGGVRLDPRILPMGAH